MLNSLVFTLQPSHARAIVYSLSRTLTSSVFCVGGESIGGDLCTRKWQRNGGMDVTVSCPLCRLLFQSDNGP